MQKPDITKKQVLDSIQDCIQDGYIHEEGESKLLSITPRGRAFAGWFGILIAPVLWIHEKTGFKLLDWYARIRGF